MQEQKLIIAGFGGQGVLLIGRLLTYAGMNEGKHVTWIPSYGPEMRGGTANCTVIVSEKEIGSPITPVPDSVIAMNQPSLDKFEPMIKKGGLLIMHSEMITRKPERKDVDVIEVPLNKMAKDLGNEKVLNMIALGAYVEKTKIVSMETVFSALKEALPKRHHHFIPLNEKALKKGVEFVRK